MRPVAFGLLASLLVPAPAAALELGLPVDCVIGDTCFLQNLVDLDPGPGALDFQCGARTYDGHKGVDFRLPDRQAMERGVAVVAAAAGEVARVRDGEADRRFDAPRPSADGRECGNGVVIDHGDGWETQYCHMRAGSIVVTPGQRVGQGEKIGLVGASGETEFVHLHISVRHGEDVIDPFTGAGPGETTCGETRPGLWNAATADALARPPGEVVNVGFAESAVEMVGIEEARYMDAVPASGPPQPLTLSPSAAAIVFYGRSIGVLKGDRQRLTLHGPGIDIDDTVDPADRAKAQLMAFIGKKRPQGGWPTGRYDGRYELVRDGEVVAAGEAAVVVE